MTLKHNAKKGNPLMDELMHALHVAGVITWKYGNDGTRCDFCQNEAVVELVGTRLCGNHEKEVTERMK